MDSIFESMLDVLIAVLTAVYVLREWHKICTTAPEILCKLLKHKEWLPSLSVFRTFVTMPPPEGRLLLAQVQDFVAASGVPL